MSAEGRNWGLALSCSWKVISCILLFCRFCDTAGQLPGVVGLDVESRVEIHHRGGTGPVSENFC